MAWSVARFADKASEQAKAICCGNAKCFHGYGCDTAKWITQRLETTGYRLVRRPRIVESPSEEPA